MIKLFNIDAGLFKLDGGAMFGVVPKKIWNKLNPADKNNLSVWTMRSLLVQTGNKLILIDNGMGDKQGEQFLSHYFPHGNHSIERSLQYHGFTSSDITDNVLTHLHFDHCGGGICWNEDKTKLISSFDNATFHVSRGQWETATNPNVREANAFFEENILPMKELGKLNILEQEQELFPNFRIRFSDGHTKGMIIPIINYEGTDLIYMADLIPSSHHVRLQYLMSYDIEPLKIMAEKEQILAEALAKKSVLFFEHDHQTQCCNLKWSKKGVVVDKRFSLAEFIKMKERNEI